MRKELFLKTKAPSIFFLFFLTGGFIFAGCYTQLETIKGEGSGGSDNGDYAMADTSGAANDTTGNNYFGDDDYRSSQYRAAFDYYSPSWDGWGDGIDPWYGDYDYPWDAMLMYPYSDWDGGYPYYGWDLGFGIGYGYGRYHNGGYRGGLGGGLRMIGSTRGAFGGRGTISANNRIGSFRPSGTSDVAALKVSRIHSRQELPWWQRVKTTTENSQARSRVAERPRSAGRNLLMTNGARNVRTPSSYSMSMRWMNHWIRTQSASVGGFGSQWGSSFRQQAPRSFSLQGAHARSSRGGRGGGRGR